MTHVNGFPVPKDCKLDLNPGLPGVRIFLGIVESGGGSICLYCLLGKRIGCYHAEEVAKTAN